MNLRIKPDIGISKTADLLLMFAGFLLIGSRLHWPRLANPLFWFWAVLAAGLAVIALGAVGYFDRYTPRPEMPGLVSLLIILPMAACISKWVLMLTSHVPPIRYLSAFRTAIIVSCLFEFIDYAVFRLQRKLGLKWRLAAHLSPPEISVLQAQIKESGVADWIEVVPCDEWLNQPMLQGNETIVISRRSVRNLKDHPHLLDAHLRGQRILDLSQLLKTFRGRVSLQRLDGWSFLLAAYYQTFPVRLYFHVKEFVEVFAAILLIIVLAPLYLALSVGVLISSGRPILFRQHRLGYRGRRFVLYKFRSMANTAEAAGPVWAGEDDPRANAFGRWLRKTRLDELPQLMNVVRGQLSFVGPRPERPEFYKMLSEPIPLFSTRLLVRPGITGWAQVRQGYASSVEECKLKLEYDLFYVQNMSPQFDLRVLFHTFAVLFGGQSGR